jgi:N-acetylglucosamine-6-sulfatase
VLSTLLRDRRLQLILVVLACISAVGGVAAASGSAVQVRSPSVSTATQPQPLTTPPTRPNIVFVLTDDLSMNLLRFMPQVQAMEQRGLTFQDYFVSDSLCCPSRSSIFTGNFPHDTHVFSNVGSEGGFHVFHRRGEEQQTFAVALKRAGYQTAMMGKYLNGYLDGPGTPLDVPQTYVPPGWSEWDVAGQAYSEFGYPLNENGVLHYYGHRPQDYLTDVLARKGVDFINHSATAGKPFFLELATFAPHQPYVPAPRDAGRFPRLTAPRPRNFDALPTDAPLWLANHGPLTATQIAQINSVFRRRAQAVQAVDEMLAKLEQSLAANGIADNTYLVFSSDNGLHTGEYRLMPGKMTAFDTDIHVPLVVVGPGVPAGVRTSAMAENIDLAKTFTAIGGTALPGDGRSLLPLLRGTTPADWRTAILVEHHGPDLRGLDPDFQQPASGSPRTYEAMRTHRLLYVEYDSGERELYDLLRDPFELHNLAARLTATQLRLLHFQLAAIENCHDGLSCWAAMDTARVLQPMRRRRPLR